MQKTLEEWLESSSDEEGAPPSRTALPHPKTTSPTPPRGRSPRRSIYNAKRHGAQDPDDVRQEDVKERRGSAVNVSRSFDSSRSGEGSFLHPAHRPVGHAPPFLPPTAPSPDPEKRVSQEYTFPGRHAGEDNEYGVMVADRGTQTVSHSETQTDPEPSAVCCAACYTQYYGHPPSAACRHGNLTPNVLGGLKVSDPSREVKSLATMKLQLQFVREQVDRVIRKYNLPSMN